MGNRLNARTFPLLFALLLLSGLQAGWAASDPFPQPRELRPAIDFWKQVFAKWTRGQVALHDNEYMDLIYEVIDLPGAVAEGQTTEQKRHVQARFEALADDLRHLERKVRDDEPLDTLDRRQQALYDRIVAAAGSHAVIGAADRLRSQRGMRERFKEGVRISGRYDGYIRRIFREYGLPEDLALLPHVESSFQYKARSSVGAVGVWQFTAPAAKTFMRLNSAVDERLDPIAAARGAARYLDDAYRRLGDWALAVTSYNHGVGGMGRAKAQFGTDFGRIVRYYKGPAFGFASRNFYAELLAVREIFANLHRHFPEGVTRDPPHSLPGIVLDKPRTVTQLARAYGTSSAKLAALNPAWTKSAAQSRVSLPAGVQVWLPHGVTQVASLPDDQPPAAAAPRKVASASRASSLMHVVQKGETPSHVAARHGVKVSELLAANKLTAKSRIFPGQRLRIPGSVMVAKATADAKPAATETVRKAPDGDGLMHVVGKGEAPATIAARYEIKVGDLLAANALGADALIYPGQRLRIPRDGTPTAPAVDRAQAAETKVAATESAPAAKPAARSSGDGLMHVVRKGEAPVQIAAKYKVKVDDLLAANSITGKARIFPGQRLVIPAGGDAGRQAAPADKDPGAPTPATETRSESTPGEKTLHVVQPGDSPVRIAERYQVKLDDLLAVNDITRETRIYPGQRLRIP